MFSILHFMIATTTTATLLFGYSQSRPILDIGDAVVTTEQLQLKGSHEQQMEQQDIACLLKRNDSLQNEFESSIREKHGIIDPDYGKLIIVVSMYK